MNIVRAMTTKIVIMGLALMVAMSVTLDLSARDSQSVKTPRSVELTIYDPFTKLHRRVEVTNEEVTFADLKNKLSILGMIGATQEEPNNEGIRFVGTLMEHRYEGCCKRERINWIPSAFDLLPSEFYIKILTMHQYDDSTKILTMALDWGFGYSHIEIVRHGSSKAARMGKFLRNMCCGLSSDQIEEKGTEILELFSKNQLTKGQVDLIMGKYKKEADVNAVLKYALKKLDGTKETGVDWTASLQRYKLFNWFEQNWFGREPIKQPKVMVADQKPSEVTVQSSQSSAQSSQAAASSLSLEATLVSSNEIHMGARENKQQMLQQPAEFVMARPADDKSDNKEGNSSKKDQ